MNITVKLTSDFICPWCLIGERRLQKAITGLFDDIQVTLVWQPYQLNPQMPVDGVDRRYYRTQKFGSWAYSQSLDKKTIMAAEHDDVAFNYAAIKKTPDTFRAHRLMAWARQFGSADGLADALFSGYFERGRDIGDPEALAGIAAENGLNSVDALEFIRGEEGAAEMRNAIRRQRQANIHGVPHFDIDGDEISGAQPLSVIQSALVRAAARRKAEQQTEGK